MERRRSEVNFVGNWPEGWIEMGRTSRDSRQAMSQEISGHKSFVELYLHPGIHVRSVVWQSPCDNRPRLTGQQWHRACLRVSRI
jgi:hypothetical protein